MAMLAEPRKKQKFSVDPRNLNWSNDESRFGQKMLEKMGWSKGKGLGATEQGQADHISVSLKNDARGLGCSKKYADTWIAHQDDFNSLLSNLNADHSNSGSCTPDRDAVASLEQTSKTSKSRLHYGKFTRGKDLSTRGAAELDCIFGKTKRAQPTQNDVDVEDKAADMTSSGEEGDQNLITSTQSVADYFAQKMAAIQRLRNSATAVTSDDQNDVIDDISTESRRNDLEMEGRNISNHADNTETRDSKKKKNKKKSKKEKKLLYEETEVQEEEDVRNEGTGHVHVERCPEPESLDSICPARKKKKKCKKTHKNELEAPNENEEKSFRVEETYENPDVTNKKRKKKCKNDMNDDDESVKTKKSRTCATDDAQQNSSKIGEKKKSKNEKKKLQVESSTSERYVLDRKSGKKINVDDLQLDKKFKGSNVTYVGPYGVRK